MIERIVERLMEHDARRPDPDLNLPADCPPFSDGTQRSALFRSKDGGLVIVLGGGLEPVEGTRAWVGIIHPEDLTAALVGGRNPRCSVESHPGYCLGHGPTESASCPAASAASAWPSWSQSTSAAARPRCGR